MAKNNSTSQGSEQSYANLWQLARTHAEHVTPIHNLFNAAVRYLLKPDKLDIKLSQVYPIVNLFKSPTFKSVAYHAAQQYYPEQLSELQPLTLEGLVNLFIPEEFASIIATTYLYRQTKRHVDPRLWQSISREVRAQIEIGALLGAAIPAIGRGRGILVGGIRYIALGLLAVDNGRKFVEYRTQLKSRELLYDIRFENNTWKCNHLQIAAILMQACGFGISAARGVGIGLDPDSSDDDLDQEARRWRAAGRWIECMIELEKPPEELDKGMFYPSENLIPKLQEEIDTIISGEGQVNWFEKTAGDLDTVLTGSLKDIQPADTDKTVPSTEEKEESAEVAQELLE